MMMIHVCSLSDFFIFPWTLVLPAKLLYSWSLRKSIEHVTISPFNLRCSDLETENLTNGHYSKCGVQSSGMGIPGQHMRTESQASAQASCIGLHSNKALQ